MVREFLNCKDNRKKNDNRVRKVIINLGLTENVIRFEYINNTSIPVRVLYYTHVSNIIDMCLILGVMGIILGVPKMTFFGFCKV